MRDPFDLSQYKLSFRKDDSYETNPFAFADFEESFGIVAEQIRLRQGAISVGFNVPQDFFTNIDSYETSTPFAIASALQIFQAAILEFVEGDIIEQYAKVPGCNSYIGFYVFASNGLPILGESNIAPDGAFSALPDPESITDIIDFAKTVGNVLNEFIFALNQLSFIHGKMLYNYGFDATCGTPEAELTSTGSSAGSNSGSTPGEATSLGSSAGSYSGSTPGETTSSGSSAGSSAGSSEGSSSGSSAGSNFGSTPGETTNPGSSAGSNFGSTPAEVTSAGSSAGSTPGESTSAGSSAGSSSGSTPGETTSANSSAGSNANSTPGETTSAGSSAGSTPGESTSEGSSYGSDGFGTLA